MKIAVMTSLLAKWNVDVDGPTRPPQRGGEKKGILPIHFGKWFFINILRI
jgi:hypothetical protein